MIKLTFNHTAFTGSRSLADFYRMVGVASLCAGGTVKTLNQVWANDREMEHLRKALRKNIRRTPANRGYTKKQNNDFANQDWSLYSPVMDSMVPIGEIWVYETPEEAKQKLNEKFERDRKEKTNDKSWTF